MERTLIAGGMLERCSVADGAHACNRAFSSLSKDPVNLRDSFFAQTPHAAMHGALYTGRHGALHGALHPLSRASCHLSHP